MLARNVATHGLTHNDPLGSLINPNQLPTSINKNLAKNFQTENTINAHYQVTCQIKLN